MVLHLPQSEGGFVLLTMMIFILLLHGSYLGLVFSLRNVKNLCHNDERHETSPEVYGSLFSSRHDNKLVNKKHEENKSDRIPPVFHYLEPILHGDHKGDRVGVIDVQFDDNEESFS
jgi:hypothetical protein